MTNAAQVIETEITHPLRAAIVAAQATHEAARAVVNALDADESIGADDPRWIAACDAETAADDALVATRAGLQGSDCPRLWDLSEGGYVYATTIATSAEDALETARANVDRVNYNDAEDTLWIDVRVHCRETDESESDTVQSDPVAPECSGLEHDWQSPIELVGGIKENPGVWGKGGGVIITEVCMCCGCKRTTDTWAQCPDTGEQGLTSVSYEQDAFTAEELAEAAE